MIETRLFLTPPVKNCTSFSDINEIFYSCRNIRVLVFALCKTHTIATDNSTATFSVL